MLANPFTEVAVPLLGILLTVLQYGSPLRTVLRVRRERRLGDVNPLPFAATVASSLGWIGYALAARNRYLICGSYLSLLLGLFFSLTAHSYADPVTRDHLAAVLIGAAAALVPLAAVGAYSDISPASNQFMWGLAANLGSLFYFASPLSTIRRVFATRSSASIHRLNSTLNTLNNTLWVVYGAAIGDYFVWGASVPAALLSMACLLLCLVFPPRPPRSPRRGGLPPKAASATAQVASPARGRPIAGAPSPQKAETPRAGEERADTRHPYVVRSPARPTLSALRAPRAGHADLDATAALAGGGDSAHDVHAAAAAALAAGARPHPPATPAGAGRAGQAGSGSESEQRRAAEAPSPRDSPSPRGGASPKVAISIPPPSPTTTPRGERGAAAGEARQGQQRGAARPAKELLTAASLDHFLEHDRPGP